MTPNEFQTAALAWLTVVSVVGAAAIATAITLYQSVKQRLNFHREDIHALNDDMQSINRALPPQAAEPVDAAPVPAIVLPPPPRPVNVTISADAPLSADEIKAAHDALDAQAAQNAVGTLSVPNSGIVGSGGSPDGG